MNLYVFEGENPLAEARRQLEDHMQGLYIKIWFYQFTHLKNEEAEFYERKTN